MKLASKSLFSKIIVACLFVGCLFVMTVEAYFCSDCTLGCSSAGHSGSSSQGELTQEPDLLGRNQSISGQGSHSVGTCQICLSPPVMPGDHAFVFQLTSAKAAPQDSARLSEGKTNPIYKPPK